MIAGIRGGSSAKMLQECTAGSERKERECAIILLCASGTARTDALSQERRSEMAEREEKQVLVVAHGDLDGVVSAALEMKRSGLSVAKTQMVFTQPFLVDKIMISEKTEKIYVLDIAPNNRDVKMTREFIERISDRLEYWVDHHQGWRIVLQELDEEEKRKFSIFENSESTARIIAVESTFPSDFPVKQLVSDANASDTRQGELSERGRLIEEAIKADLSDDSVRLSAVRWIVNGCREDEDYKRLLEAQKRYQGVQEETERLASKYDIHDGIAVVDVRNAVGDYDRTQLLIRGEQIAPTRTAVVLGKNPQNEEVITIATMDRKVNLVNLFGLPSGAAFRVSLPVAAGWTVERVLNTLSQALKK